MAIKDFVTEGVGPTSAIKYVALRGLEPNPISPPAGGGGSPLIYGNSVQFGKQAHLGTTTIFKIRMS